MFSLSCIYGIRSCAYLAHKNSNELISILEISENLNIPYHYLAKVLNRLKVKKIIRSHRGPTGGVKLARPSDQITLSDVIDALDGSSFTTECLLGLPKCDGNNPCPMHEHWSLIRAQFQDMLLDTPLSEFKDNRHRI